MYYEFRGCDNPRCSDKKHATNNIYLIAYKMGQAPSPGETIPCPRCGKGKIVRIYSFLNAIVRGSDTPVMEGNQSYMARIEGQDTKITFVDHPHTDPAYQTALAIEAKKHGIGGLSKAYRHEKTGRICVDVASNIPDPLGAIEREKKRNGVQSETKKVNTPVSRRPAGPRTPSTGKSFIPIRRV
jgi:hypothetical protein